MTSGWSMVEKAKSRKTTCGSLRSSKTPQEILKKVLTKYEKYAIIKPEDEIRRK